MVNQSVSRTRINEYTQEQDVPYTEWRRAFGMSWQQGEHMILVGPTGSGKTHTARDLMSIRDYAVVLAVKKHDDVLQAFTKSSPRYVRRKEWPPEYSDKRVLYNFPPTSLADKAQAGKVYMVMNGVQHAGAWAIFLDDTGYITGTLGLRRPLVVLMNQGRSHGISVVTAATQASSVSANIPSETLRQVRHVLMWRFEAVQDIEACARMTGLDKKRLIAAFDTLRVFGDGSSDFLAYHRGSGLYIVRQER